MLLNVVEMVSIVFIVVKYEMLDKLMVRIKFKLDFKENSLKYGILFSIEKMLLMVPINSVF